MDVLQRSPSSLAELLDHNLIHLRDMALVEFLTYLLVGAAVFALAMHLHKRGVFRLMIRTPGPRPAQVHREVYNSALSVVLYNGVQLVTRIFAKTKLLDFVSVGGWILVPKKLYDRQPAEIRPFCIVVDPIGPEGLVKALQQAKGPWPDNSRVNDQLRERAFKALDVAFGYEGVPMPAPASEPMRASA